MSRVTKSNKVPISAGISEILFTLKSSTVVDTFSHLPPTQAHMDQAHMDQAHMDQNAKCKVYASSVLHKSLQVR